MALPLTPDRLRLAYEFLTECPPFIEWNLPHGEDVNFRVSKRLWYGAYFAPLDETAKPLIEISCRMVTSLEMLFVTMAHEMIHLHEHVNHVCSSSKSVKHGPQFQIFAQQVCDIFHFNRDTF